MAMSVSFRAAKVDDEARELLANTVLEELVPRIGRPLP
jgi:hypothetical protein